MNTARPLSDKLEKKIIPVLVFTDPGEFHTVVLTGFCDIPNRKIIIENIVNLYTQYISDAWIPECIIAT